jgi:hypothetical protein
VLRTGQVTGVSSDEPGWITLQSTTELRFQPTYRQERAMKQFLTFACAIGLLASCIGVDYAAAAGTCRSQARPEFMSGSPPKGQRAPIAIQADRTDNAHCTLQANNCVAPTPNPTVTETAPTCKCECQ